MISSNTEEESEKEYWTFSTTIRSSSVKNDK